MISEEELKDNVTLSKKKEKKNDSPCNYCHVKNKVENLDE